MSATNWRGLCEELAACWPSTFDAPDCLSRARAALAQPEPEVRELSDQELDDLADATPWHGSPRRFGREVARAAIAADRARWGRPAPAPAGEVGELVEWLRDRAESTSLAHNALRITRAADLLERQATACAICERERLHQSTRAADLEVEHQAAPVPVAVSERLPEPSVKVLAHYFNDLGKGRTICAIWVPAKTRSDSYGDDDFTEYDEGSDTFYWPEGWYEAIENWDDLGYVKVDEGRVIYWQPLPKWPVHALPLPQGEVGP